MLRTSLRNILLPILMILNLSCATSTNKTYNDLSLKSPDGLRLYIYRKPGVWGAAIKSRLNVNGEDVVKVSNGTFSYFEFSLGQKYQLAVSNLLDSLHHKGQLNVKSSGEVYLRMKTNSIVEEVKASDWTTVIFGPMISGKRQFEVEPKEIKDGVSFYLFDLVNQKAALQEIKSLKLKYVQAKPLPDEVGSNN